MANVNEGLGTPEPGENVNSEAGFEAILAQKVGRTEELEAREPQLGTDVAAGLTEGTAAARDAAGRFTAQADEEATEEETLEEPEDEEQEVEEGEDGDVSPELEALLAKHNGDALKAMAEIETRRKNAESKIGEQGNAMGQLRRELDELRGELRARTETQPVGQQNLPDIPVDKIEEMIEEHGGLNVAIWAVNNRPDLYERVHRVWRVDEPDEAADFRLDYKLQQQRLELEKSRGGAQPDEWVASQKQAAAINQTVEDFASKTADWQAVAPHMLAALEQAPARVQKMVNSEDPEERLDGVSIVADKARLLAAGKLGATAKEKQTAAARERKKSATVASGSLRPTGPPGSDSEEMSSEERIKAFKKELMETETTSVSEGLTYAKT